MFAGSPPSGDRLVPIIRSDGEYDRAMAYDPAEWSDLFVATAGATAALTGLLFVAVSINLERIITFKGLPERALATLLLLLAVTVVSIFSLAPQSLTALGIELLAVGSGCLLAVPALSRASFDPDHQSRSQMVGQMILALLGTLPILIAGLSLIAETGGGLYWLLAGIVSAIVGSGANAWVLLVEILR